MIAIQLLVAPAARAAGPVDVQIAGQAGGGTNPTSAAANPLGPELGARAGVSWLHYYGGLSLLYSLGSTTSATCAGPVVTACTTSAIPFSARSLRYGLEGGYDLGVLPRVTVRPRLAVGELSLTQSSAVQVFVSGRLEALDGTSRGLYLEPGVAGLVSLGSLLLGADVGALWLPQLDRSRAALTAHVQVGVQL